MAFFACSALFWTAVCVFYWGLRSIRRGRPTSAKTRALFHLGRTRALVCTCCRVCFADSSKPCFVAAYFFASTVFPSWFLLHGAQVLPCFSDGSASVHTAAADGSGLRPLAL